MLIVFSPIFMADTKTIFCNNFEVCLRLFFRNLEGHKVCFWGMFSQKVVSSQFKDKTFLENHDAEFFYHPQILRSCHPEVFFKKCI